MEQQLEVSDGVDDAPRARLLRRFVAEALEAEPGPGLLAALTALMAREDLTARELVEVAVAWKRMIAHATAGQLAAVADLDRALPSDGARRGGSTVPAGRRAADELAAALGMAPAAASRLVNLARRADAELPAAADALAEGRLDPTQLRVLAAVTANQPAQVVRHVEAVAVRRAPRRTAAQLRGELETAAQQADPGFAARHAAAGRSDRDVGLRASPLAGCRRLVLDLPALEATGAWLAVHGAAVAARQRGTRPDGTIEDRSLGQLRADLTAARLTGRDDPDNPDLVPTPDALAVMAEVQVVVSADTLAGSSELPATIPGTGPVDAAHAREVAGRARWRRLVADPATGTLRIRGTRAYPPAANARMARVRTDPADAPATGGAGYRVPGRLRAHVHTRDATCIGPACHHATVGTQLDHTIDHGAVAGGRAGRTTAENLGSGCQRMHNAKTHGGWQLRQPTPGSFVWTSPTGRTYTRPAQPLVPGWTARPDPGDDQPP